LQKIAQPEEDEDGEDDGEDEQKEVVQSPRPKKRLQKIAQPEEDEENDEALNKAIEESHALRIGTNRALKNDDCIIERNKFLERNIRRVLTETERMVVAQEIRQTRQKYCDMLFTVVAVGAGFVWAYVNGYITVTDGISNFPSFFHLN
jgi:hypothetical protein